MLATIPKREFKDAISGLSRVIPNKTALPILRGVRFSADDNGTITAEATDLDQTASYSFQSACADGAGSFIVDLDSLKPLTKGNGPDTLTFDSTEDNEVSVTTSVGGQALRRSLTGLDPEDWPETTTANLRTIPVPGFLQTYRTLANFASTDDTRYVLQSVNLDVQEKNKDGSVMVSTDGRRLASRNHMTLPIPESTILRTSKFLAWSRLPSDAEIGLAQNPAGKTIGIKAGQWSYNTKAIDGTYPNWRQVFPTFFDDDCHVVMSEADCKLLLDALPSLPGDTSVYLVVRNGKLSAWARGVDEKEWSVLEIPGAKVESKQIVYAAVDRDYLRQALEAGLFRDIHIHDSLSPILSEDGTGGTHVLMPMRGDGPEEIVKEAEALAEQAGDKTATPDAAEDSAKAGHRPAEGTQPATEADAVNNEQQSEKLQGDPKQQTQTKKGKKTMADHEQKTTGHTPEQSALERALEAFDQAKCAVRDANSMLVTLAAELRNVVRDQKAQAADLDKARNTLAKLQAINL